MYGKTETESPLFAHGVQKFVRLAWSLQQNASHHGLKGSGSLPMTTIPNILKFEGRTNISCRSFFFGDCSGWTVQSPKKTYFVKFPFCKEYRHEMRAQGVARAAKAKTEVTEIGAKDTRGDSIFLLGFLHWSSSILCCEFDCTKESFDQFLDERTCFYQHQGGSRFAPVEIKRVSFRWLYLYMILMYTHSIFFMGPWLTIDIAHFHILELVAHKAGHVGNILGNGRDHQFASCLSSRFRTWPYFFTVRDDNVGWKGCIFRLGLRAWRAKHAHWWYNTFSENPVFSSQ